MFIFQFTCQKKNTSFKKYTNWAKLSHFWGKCVFWHVEDLSWEISCMNVKKNIIVNFTIQKLKNKHISLKKYTNWAMLSPVTQDLEFTSWPASCGPNTYTIQCMGQGISLKSERNNPWFKPWFNILLHTQSIVYVTV